MTNMLIKKINEEAVTPTRGSKYAAGYDLYACINEKVEILPGETKLIGTGIAIQLPECTFGAIFARSGLAVKKGLRPANCVGVIDEDYRGEVMIALHNDSAYTHIIEPKERIAQLIVMPYMSVNCYLVSELNETERDDGGFGSTGSK